MALEHSDFEWASRLASIAGKERERSLLGSISENSTRLARASCVYITKGPGTFIEGGPFVFGTQFIEPPSISYGTSIAPVSTALTSPSLTNLPEALGLVYRWAFDETGKLFTGAYVAATVKGNIPSSLEVEHHFTFVGVGLKVSTNIQMIG